MSNLSYLSNVKSTLKTIYIIFHTLILCVLTDLDSDYANENPEYPCMYITIHL